MSVASRTVAAVAAAAAGLSIALVAACSGKPGVTFDVTLPAAVVADAAWLEVVALDGVCPEGNMLEGGLPTVGATRRAAFRLDATATVNNGPVFGDLAKGSYAFLAVAKRDDCGVIATGCAKVDVKESRSIALSMTATGAPTAACTGGAVCRNARCVPSLDNADPGVGARCSLQLLGAGPLETPLAGESVTVSAPAVVATPGGFLIAYREWVGRTGVARLTLVPVDTAGGAAPPTFETLADRCAASEERDAVGMAMSGDTGLVAVARASCGANATGLNFFAVDAKGAVARRGVIGTPAVKSVTLSQGHALARAPGGSDFFLAALRDGRGALSQTRDVAAPSQAADVGGAAPVTFVAVASTDALYAVLSGAAARAATSADGGVGAAAGAELRLQIAAAGSEPALLGAPTTFTGSWGSIAAHSARVVVASDGEAFEQPVVFHFFDLDGKARIVDGYTPDTLGRVLFADVAVADDRLFAAVEQAGALSLVAFDHATSKPAILREVSFARDPRIPSVANVRDGNVAVAASPTRVAVAWTTAAHLDANDSVGGYAVFACRAP